MKPLSLKELGQNMVDNIKNSIAVTSKDELTRRVGDKLKAPVFYGPVGCEQCEGLGYKGRL